MIDEDFEPIIRRGDLKRYKDKDLFETVEEVFDTKTVMTILYLMRKRIIRRMNGVISAGKEARVYLGFGWKNEPLAVKIYLTSTAVFKKGMLKYIIGDPRFEDFKPGDTRDIIYAWTRKEFRNLKRMFNVGVKVPKPIAFKNNILVMEFMGENNKRYPLLIEAYSHLSINELRKIYEYILEELFKTVCKANLVHGDLSEYNIMIKPGPDIVIIDVSQAVHIDHPNSLEFLIRDINNINRFFREKVGLDELENVDEILEVVKKCLRSKRED
ncbi:protein of unknown function RIO1 [Staphylothermus marinus F1]|uniref:non-specific serine/threonine protein kinase n=1 Tax=Staphylothermus marinus (strain ATCC 43588 / DSM 3639 / JCM 9404 / F1) TaxID=399550 RepID=A3DNJ2_STAMF|nr:serine protein kinase RIO [Staphylothermus marinus]ABN70202.1 protein of unknown function RIO1 [Staphylothermus marinus F1]